MPTLRQNMRSVNANTNAYDDATYTATSAVPSHTHTITLTATKQPRARAISNAAANTSRGCTTTQAIDQTPGFAMPMSSTYFGYAHARYCMRMITRSRMPLAPHQ